MLKPYMAFSRSAGQQEGAILVFAHTIKEAKKISYPFLYCWNVDSWIDLGVRLLRNGGHLFSEADQDKLQNNTAHVIDNPKSCISCEMWGYPIDEHGLCENCKDYQEEIHDSLLRS